MIKFSLSLILLWTCTCLAGPFDSIYGKDDRINVEKLQDSAIKKLSSSTAAKIKKSLLREEASGLAFSVQGKTLSEARNICPDEPFAGQYSLASCSGFLVAPDLLVTAGHCMQDQEMCDSFNWVFDYKNDEIRYDEQKVYFAAKNIYSCKKILGSVLQETATRLDYAVIQLDRPVEGRAPLKFRTIGKIADDASVFVVGYPLGLPAIYAGNAHVVKNDPYYFFSADLDTFHINSGSPVFNEKTFEVEGILVRGQSDTVFDQKANCFRMKYIDRPANWEDVTRITAVAEIAPSGVPFLPRLPEPEPVPNTWGPRITR